MKSSRRIIMATAILAMGLAAPHQTRAAGSDKMGGALRHLLMRARSGTDAGSRSQEASGRAGQRLESLSRALIVEETASDPARGPIATFKAIVDGSDPSVSAVLESAGARVRGRIGRVISFDGPVLEAERFASVPSLVRLDVAKRLKPELNITKGLTGAAAVRDPAGPYGVKGAGTLVAVIDTGQDLKHKDFRRPNRRNRTRFRAVYNMSPGCKGTPPPGHGDGCYFDEGQINRFLQGRRRISYGDPPALFGHGTHVMGIAAGNGQAARPGTKKGKFVGMAPHSRLIGVKVFNRSGDFTGDLVEALQFLDEEQTRQGNLPLAVNISLGGHFGAHDGSDPDEIAIDDFIADGISNGKPRVVVKSAGNGGPQGVYAGGTLTELVPANHPFTVPGGSACALLPGTGNDSFLADLWYEGDVELEIQLTGPSGATSMFTNSTGNPGGTVQQNTSDGTIFVDCPDVPNPVNGLRECIFGVDDTAGAGPRVGTWDVQITATTVPMTATGQYDIWIAQAERGQCSWFWDQPSFGKTISIPGTSMMGITVGASMSRTRWVNIDGVGFEYINPNPIGDIGDFSSVGPTRDGRIKPDLVAPGMGIASSRSRSVVIAPNTEGRFRTLFDGQHMIMEGTSMAAPHVTGAAALLWSLNSSLDATQILGLLTGNTETASIPGGPFLPNEVWGHGKLDVAAAAAATP